MKSFGAFSEATAKCFAWHLMMTVIVETVASNNLVVPIPLVFIIGNNIIIMAILMIQGMDAVVVVVAGINGAAIPFLFEPKAKAGVGGISPAAVVDHVIVNVASTIALKQHCGMDIILISGGVIF